MQLAQSSAAMIPRRVDYENAKSRLAVHASSDMCLDLLRFVETTGNMEQRIQARVLLDNLEPHADVFNAWLGAIGR